MRTPQGVFVMPRPSRLASRTLDRDVINFSSPPSPRCERVSCVGSSSLGAVKCCKRRVPATGGRRWPCSKEEGAWKEEVLVGVVNRRVKEGMKERAVWGLEAWGGGAERVGAGREVELGERGG